MTVQKLARTGRCDVTLVLVVVVGLVRPFGAAPSQLPANRSVVNSPLVHVAEGLLTVKADDASLKDLPKRLPVEAASPLRVKGQSPNGSRFSSRRSGSKQDYSACSTAIVTACSIRLVAGKLDIRRTSQYTWKSSELSKVH